MSTTDDDLDKQTEDLGRLAFRTGGDLRLLVERMKTLNFKPDGHEPEEIAELAAALQGMALRCAMHTGNTAMLSDLTGRRYRDLGNEPTGGV